ncbi:MAG: hypothetical protein PVF65_06385 [Sphingomonadales bacterium]|jgi:hypothetical protein
MSRSIEEMFELARKKPMSEQEINAQRRSFAYGNAHIENEDVTWDMVDEAMKKTKG